MKSIKLNAAAKVNLSLDIVGRMENGYHELDMIVCPVSWYDVITICEAEEGITLNCDGGIPTDERNIAYRAAEVILKDRCDRGVNITIEKHIPSQAGLGGGSSDGAAVLYGINMLYNLGLTKEELMGMGLKLGADVPLFLAESAVRARGIGEKLTKVDIHAPIHMVILKPEAGLSTPEVYGGYDTVGKPFALATDRLVKGLEEGFMKIAYGAMGNVMEPAAMALCPDVRRAKESLLACGALVAPMSGSGSAVFGVFESEAAADAAVKELEATWSICRKVKTVAKGIIEA